MDEKANEALNFLKCDRVVNSVVAKVDVLLPQIINVLKKKKLNKNEVELLQIASHAFVCERIMARIEERRFRETDEKIDLGCLCSDNKSGSCLDCKEKVCKLISDSIMDGVAVED